MNIKKTRYYSYCIGGISKGCRMCVEGRKLVLYITGLCSDNCYYCPLSDKRRGKDIIWANEKPITSVMEAIDEARLCDSTGAGITGGDPLLRLERTSEYIKALKKEFGKEFHIHLYTSLTNVNYETLKKLHDAGLDEIRFHPNIENNQIWERLNIAKEFDWDVGVEIPAIPKKLDETKKLVDYLKGRIDFLNLNELEISDTNADELIKRGHKTKDELSYAVSGSEHVAKKIMGYCRTAGFKVHYCTAKLKDKVQFFERIKRRAGNIALKTDIITKDGTLRRGVVYLDEFKPGFGYNKKIEDMKKEEREKYIKKLRELKKYIHEQYKLSEEELFIDKRKIRFLTSTKIADKFKFKFRKIDMVSAIVEEYPTYDQLEIEVMFL